MSILIIDLQYLASIIEYKNLINSSYIKIEQYERWQKTGFRNRCVIAGANGLLNLGVPIMGGRHSGKWIREVGIDNSRNWQTIHWRSIVSAYNRSPWFEFYRDELAVFFHTRYELLWNWNLDLLFWVLKKLGCETEIGFTDGWQKEYPGDQFRDFRNRVLPKNYSSFAADCPRYRQVFEDRLGFQANLSILDLLFCTGPDAGRLLKE